MREPFLVLSVHLSEVCHVVQEDLRSPSALPSKTPSFDSKFFHPEPAMSSLVALVPMSQSPTPLSAGRSAPYHLHRAAKFGCSSSTTDVDQNQNKKAEGTYTTSDNLLNPTPSLLQDGLQVLTARSCQICDAAPDYFSVWTGGNLSSDKDLASGFDGLGVGSCCCGGCQ